MKILLIIILIYIVLLADFTITVNKLKIEYNGLLWVILDYYSILRYNSGDSAIHWLKIN